MADNPLQAVLRRVRRAAGVAAAAGHEDRQLLERFLRGRDEAAFAALVRRHGPLVLGVCRRLLRDPHDCDDAFQATFLVLLRKAASLRRRELLAGWLHGVARRTALKARAGRARRQAREGQAPALPEAEPAGEVAGRRELRAVLDDEVGRLPARYRLPVVLCYLEGVTFAEAARRLGWPAGTVAGRLARARALLRRRLTRRGVTLSAAGVAAALSPEAPAAVPAALLGATVRAGLLVAAPGAAAGAVSPSVMVLTKGVLKTMFLIKLKTTVAILLAACGAGAGLWVAAHARLAAEQPGPAAKVVPQERKPVPKKEAAPAPEVPEEDVKMAILDDAKVKALLDAHPGGDKMKTLLKDCYEAAHTEVRTRYQQYLAGRGTLDILTGAFLRLLEAEKELSDKKPDRIAAREHHLQRVKQIEEIVQAQYQAGRASLADHAQARFWRLQAEIWVEREKGK
jgi:RNA polymerase sigma factor (sigma-70 family)